jgi:putative DNA methylase
MSDHPVKRRKKLIEVAIPLEAINAASAREKSIRHGHPSTLHLWWARRPLAAARAVIFCQMVDDPSAVPDEFPTEEAQENERLRLFALISELVTWENTTNEGVLNRAREEIRRSWRRCCSDNADHPEAAELFDPEKLPGFHDPFAGGGALPLEAQRLGLEAYASDLNPVAVLINKAMIEIPPKFAGMPPVNPESRSKKELIKREWKGAQGLAEDVRYYGQWMRDEAEKRIGHLYPKAEVTPETVKDRPDLKPYLGQSLNVVAWIWARTAKSPNPAFGNVDVPLISNFMLSAKPGKEAYVEPVIEGDSYHFRVNVGKPPDPNKARCGTKTEGRGANFRCLMSQAPISGEYLKAEGMAGKLGARLMAIVAETPRGRTYLSPTSEHDIAAKCKWDVYRPTLELPKEGLGRTNFWCKLYGLTDYGKLFTERQLVALSTFTSLVGEVASQVRLDWLNANTSDDLRPLRDGGLGSTAYAEAISVYMGCAVDYATNYWSEIATPADGFIRGTFARQGIPMTWDFAEAPPFGATSGNWMGGIEWIAKAVEALPLRGCGEAGQADAAVQSLSIGKIISTDPPYYDNIGYADLSDFFYVWLRQSLRRIYPDLFATLAVPKAEELVATPYRQGSKSKAEAFFLQGMTHAMSRLAEQSHPALPVSIYYAFKQSESKADTGTASTGWETFLDAVVRAGFSICGTWPLRTERSSRSISIGTNALASSIVLICHKRQVHAKTLTRQQFRRELHMQLPKAIRELETGNIAPVDMAQAAIGPGMAIFSRAKAILNPDDSPMTVREALIDINAALDECLSQDEGELDADSRFALTLFESYGYAECDFGDAEGLAKARNISVDGVAKAGILRCVAGKTWLLRRDQLDDEWDPTRDDRLCVWEATQHLIKRLESSGEGAAAELLEELKKVAGHGDLAANCRALAYRLYNHCEKTKQAEEARAYNGLVIAWPELERLAASQGSETTVQASLI